MQSRAKTIHDRGSACTRRLVHVPRYCYQTTRRAGLAMPRVSERHLRALSAFFTGGVRDDGEQYMHCPFHEDKKRSASLNVWTGEYHCFSCGTGCGVIDVIRRRSQWVDPGVASTNGSSRHSRTPSKASKEIITLDQIEWWH